MSKTKKNIIEYLACPICMANLERISNTKIECKGLCKSLYSIDDEIPILLPQKLESFKQLEADYHTKESENFTDLNMKSSLRVTHYHDKYLRSFNHLKKDSVIIEVGCGDGIDASNLLNKGFVVIQSDISIGMVKMARINTNKNRLQKNSSYVVCDAEQLPCKEKSIDGIMIVAALHHLPSPKIFFQQVKKTLKPGGFLVIGFEPNKWPYFIFYPLLRYISRAMKFRRYFKNIETSIGDMETEGFSKAELKKLLDSSGLEIVEIQRIWYLNGFIHTILTSLNSKISRGSPIDLPNWLQRIIIHIDNFLSKIPFINNYCWHWSIIAKLPSN